MNIKEFKDKYKPILTGVDDTSIIHTTPHQLQKALSYSPNNIWVVEDSQISPYTGKTFGKGLVITMNEHNFETIKIEWNQHNQH